MEVVPFFLHFISRSSTLHHLNQILSHLTTTALVANLAVATKLVQRFSELGRADLSCRVFAAVPRPDLFLSNVLIRLNYQHGNPDFSISLYTQLLRDPRLRPDSFSFAFASKSAALAGDPIAGRVIHGQSVVCGHENDRFVGSAVMDMYVVFGQLEIAQKVFDGITEPDAACCNTLISGFARNGFCSEGLKVFERMFNGGRRWDPTTLAAVLPAGAELQDLRFGRLVHCLAVKCGFLHHKFVATGLVSLYSKCGELRIAELLFRGMEKADVVAWNAMMAGFLFNGNVQRAVDVFREFLSSQCKADSSTVLGVIPASAPFGHGQLSETLHGFSVKTGLDSNPSVSTALITVYSRLNDMESAQKLFDSTSEKCVITWNAMISAYTQNGSTQKAVSLFKQMQGFKVKPNPVTVTSMLSACAQLGALSLGKWIHQIADEQNFQSNIYVRTAMIDMYAKCGSMAKARRIFDEMADKNVVTWNAMIAGYGLHGHGNEALRLYNEMLDVCISPTGVTFLSVLYACSHSGLVEEGYAIFKSMEPNHGIIPGSEHYACVVDLLGRAGKLDKCLAFIKEIPGNPGPGAWGALLGACMKHKNTDIALVASEKLFELQPDSTGHYVLLSNIHSAKRNYPEAARLREVVRSKNLAKTPGCTLIEIDNTVHTFVAGDQLHERAAAIYSELETLTAKMVEVGYRPLTSSALYDVEDEEKELMVKVHSEKLAICFGLISTKPGTEIKIIKNLRVCLDCHTATKYISKVTQRCIIVRDANRFHHFRDGSCSCGDYW